MNTSLIFDAIMFRNSQSYTECCPMQGKDLASETNMFIGTSSCPFPFFLVSSKPHSALLSMMPLTWPLLSLLLRLAAGDGLMLGERCVGWNDQELGDPTYALSPLKGTVSQQSKNILESLPACMGS